MGCCFSNPATQDETEHLIPANPQSQQPQRKDKLRILVSKTQENLIDISHSNLKVTFALPSLECGLSNKPDNGDVDIGDIKRYHEEILGEIEGIKNGIVEKIGTRQVTITI